MAERFLGQIRGRLGSPIVVNEQSRLPHGAGRTTRGVLAARYARSYP